MKKTGAEWVVQALEDENVAFAFGIPGTHNIELYDVLANSSVRPILVTDEQSASFMADGVWRASGKLACANVVPGAGLTHAMSGIGEAFLDTVPLLVLGCGIRRDTGKSYQLHHVDQLAMVKPVTKGQFLPANGGEIYGLIRKACRLAREGAPGPVMVEIPADHYLGKHEGEIVDPGPAAASPPSADQVARAVELLSKCRRPLLYVGLGAAKANVVALAERLDAPVASTFQGKGVFPESHPLSVWPGFGDAAPPFARSVFAECDGLLAIGCRFGEVATGSYGVKPPHPFVHVDIDPDVLNRNYPADLAIAADATAFVAALLERLPSRSADAALRDRIRAGRAALEDDSSGERVSPARLLRSIQKQYGPETIFTADSGNGTFVAMEFLRLDKPGKFLAPVDYSCMGYAIPASIGAKLARPDCPVACLAGDGAFLMTGLELLTAANYEVPVVVFLLHDRELSQIAQFQSVAMNRKTCTHLPDYDVEAFAKTVGVEFLRLGRDDEIDSVVRRAAELGRPVLVDVAIDYSRKTWFTKGVVRTNFGRLPWKDRLRFLGRALVRKVTG